MSDASKLATIELRLERLAHLFDPLDPFPVPTRDLSRTVEEFIVAWAREHHPKLAFELIIHAPEQELDGRQSEVREAISLHFRNRADRLRGDLHELFGNGRIALMIGLCVLGLCVLLSAFVAPTVTGPLGRFLTEGLIIAGWVANWRPIEIFFYDWWPLAQRRRLFLRLAAAPVSFRSVPGTAVS